MACCGTGDHVIGRLSQGARVARDACCWRDSPCDTGDVLKEELEEASLGAEE